MDLLRIIVLIHIFLGFLLVYFAARAFKRTRYIPMIYLAIGFLLITVGDTIIGDFTESFDEGSRDIIEEMVEIFGFVFVIFAVIKS
jgi:hypothetical protein